MREVHAVERRSRDVMRAAYVIPNLVTAVQEGEETVREVGNGSNRVLGYNAIGDSDA